jgi:hypothetical protein
MVAAEMLSSSKKEARSRDCPGRRPPTRHRGARAGALATALLAASLGGGVLSPGCRDPRGRAAQAQAGPALSGEASDLGNLTDPNARLDALAGQYLDDTAAASPVGATWLGIHGWDAQLDDTSAAEQAREAARLRRVIDRLDGIPAATLDARHQLDRSLLERHARLALFELTDVRALERDPVRYVSIATAGTYELLAGQFAPLPDRLRAIVARLGRVRPLFDEARKNLRNPPELLTRYAVELAQSTRSFLADTLPRVVQLAGDDRLLADFRTAQGDALRAFDDYVNFLQKDLLARSHGDVGIGRERLLERLRLRESIDVPAEPLLAMLVAAAERELKAAQKRFEETARQVAPGKTPPEALRLLDDDHPTSEQLLPSVQQAVDQVFTFAREHRLFAQLVEAPRAEVMPPFLWGFALVENGGPFEPKAWRALYVDPVNPSWDRKAKEEHLRGFGRAPISLFAVHEPLAHGAQVEAQRRAPSTIQRLSVGPAFVEGFPRYLEQLALDEGLGGADPKLRLALRRETLLATCRFVAALRIHAQGARVDDVVKLFSDAAWMDDSVARREAERVAADPMVLDEALGMLALARLRDDVVRERGPGLTMARFHEELLAHGALPLGTLRRLLLGDAVAASRPLL